MGKLINLIRFLLTILFIMGSGFKSTYAQPNGRGELYMNDRLVIPFDIHYQSSSKPKLSIINGEEKISLILQKRNSDSLYFLFPFASGALIFHEKTMRGYWLNLNKTMPQQIPLTLSLRQVVEENYCLKFEHLYEENYKDFSGVFSVEFDDQKEKTRAIALFNSRGPALEGTFRTETGDYRYLSGGVFNGVLKLSCFDGYHAYLFEAYQDSSRTLQGVFYAGTRYRANWTGVKNPRAFLLASDSISFPVNGPVELDIMVQDLRGKQKQLGRSYFQGKPTVVQLLGSWCPNCLDESQYIQSMISSGRFKGVRFIGVSFENGKTPKDKIKRIKAFKNRLSLTYPVFLGGEATVEEASRIFHQLNGVFSFPTTLFLDKKGRIIEVHSGFDGPATGVHYEALKQKTEGLLLNLMLE